VQSVSLGLTIRTERPCRFENAAHIEPFKCSYVGPILWPRLNYHSLDSTACRSI